MITAANSHKIIIFVLGWFGSFHFHLFLVFEFFFDLLRVDEGGAFEKILLGFLLYFLFLSQLFLFFCFLKFSLAFFLFLSLFSLHFFLLSLPLHDLEFVFNSLHVLPLSLSIQQE